MKYEKPQFFDNWMTSEEAAHYLRKSIGALRILAWRHQVPFRKFGRRLYFKKSELDALLEGQ
ncbi:MAG: helix-turn-helix domain-containing protein [Xanthomonadaceae bacterium]|nr:helix-turn-helix domain-containing protein [Xanthomonadaceae bacterium]